MSSHSYRPSPLEQVVTAIADLKHANGSLIKHIVQHVRNIHEPTPVPVEKIVERRVKRGLREGVTHGVLVYNAGRYRLADNHVFNRAQDDQQETMTRSRARSRHSMEKARYKARRGGYKGGRQSRGRRRGRQKSKSSGYYDRSRSNRKRRRRRKKYSDTSATSLTATSISSHTSKEGGKAKSTHSDNRSDKKASDKSDGEKSDSGKKEKRKGRPRGSEKNMKSEKRDDGEKSDKRRNPLKPLASGEPDIKKPKKSKSNCNPSNTTNPHDDYNLLPLKKSQARLTLNKSTHTNLPLGRLSRPRISKSKSRTKSKSRPRDPSLYDDNDSWRHSEYDYSPEHPSYLN